MDRRAPIRLLLAALLASVALVAQGCGNRIAVQTIGETEGIYVEVADLSYQVQLSRILNPADVEDRSYLKGLAPGISAPGKGQAWFGVFMRVSNPTSQFKVPTSSFSIVDTRGGKFTPVPINNPLTYEPSPLRPGGTFPDPNSIAGQGVVGGGLILFKVGLTSLANRPLELRIAPPPGSSPRRESIIDLDV